jgi:hypothetical protein
MRTYEEMIKTFGNYALVIEYKSMVISLENQPNALETVARSNQLILCEKEILERMDRGNKLENIIRYGIDFYDMFDGWIGMIDQPNNQFESFEVAIIARDRLNDELDDKNKKVGEHYGVFKIGGHVEIDCPADKWEIQQ